MGTVVQILIFVIFGAIIGGVTNKIAIYMLFKPYNKKYIFNIPIPLTPGLIPRRREEASRKLGNIISENILNEDVFIEKVNNKETRQLIEAFVDQQIETIEKKALSISDVLEALSPGLTEKFIERLELEIKERVESNVTNIYNQNIGTVLPDNLERLLNQKLKDATPLIKHKVYAYLTSDSGTKNMYTMVDEFFKNRGRIEKSLGVFLPKDLAVTMIKKEFKQLIEHPKMTEILEGILKDELNKLKTTKISSFVSKNTRDNITSHTTSELNSKIRMRELLNTPIAKIDENMFNTFKSRGKHRVIDKSISYMSTHIGTVIQQLKLAEIIKSQIDSFELSRLEYLVKSVSDKELKMITLLGFLLGGNVGLLQSLIVVLY